MPKRTTPITRAEIDKMDAANPERLYKKKFAALREELGEELAHKALVEWISHQRAESRKQGGILTVREAEEVPAQMGRPKYMPILDRAALALVRQKYRVTSQQLSKRMGWPDYVWSRLENGNLNFTLERGIEISARLEVHFKTLMLPEANFQAAPILQTYQENLELDLKARSCTEYAQQHHGRLKKLVLARVKERSEDGFEPSVEEIESIIEEISMDEIDDGWKMEEEWQQLELVRSRIDEHEQAVRSHYEGYAKKKLELEMAFRGMRERIENGEVNPSSVAFVAFEAEHIERISDMDEHWYPLLHSIEEGSGPAFLKPEQLGENPGVAHRIWIDDVKEAEWQGGVLLESNDPGDDDFVNDHTEQEVRDAGLPPPQPASQLPQLPIYGSARAGSDSIDLDRGAAALSWTERPYFLAGVGNAYGCYVNSDSMYPVYSEGALLFVHPSKPVRKGDDCIVEVQKENKEPVGLVKRLLRKSSEKYVFEQFNPPGRIEFAASEIKTLHLVVGSLTSGS
jgi:phage repressor protein C with HTH and peptisase S24 domain